MAFDPMAWKDEDGMVYNLYIAVATDACNSTTRTEPCVDGQSIDLWRAPKLHSPPAAWEELGSMFTTRDDYLQKNSRRGEMVTLSYTGHIKGDPRGGKTRLLTNNICHGCTYYLGVQSSGSRFTDRNGAWAFDGAGEQGTIDWGAVVALAVASTLCSCVGQ